MNPPWTPFTFFGSEDWKEEEEKLLMKATGAEVQGRSWLCRCFCPNMHRLGKFFLGFYLKASPLQFVSLLGEEEGRL